VLLLTIPSRFLHEPVFHKRFSALLVLIWNFAAQKMYVKSSSRGDSAAAAASVGLDIPLGPSSDPMARSKKAARCQDGAGSRAGVVTPQPAVTL